MGREPADDDLIGVLVPEKVEPHTVAVLAGVSPDDVELQEHALRGTDGILDVVGFALLTGADGVHIGQDDLPLEQAVRLAPDLIIGR